MTTINSPQGFPQNAREYLSALGRMQGRAKVLVVDDLEENTRLLESFLKPKGFEVIKAHSGEEALKAVQTSPPDVILLDLVMPNMDGFEVCQVLKNDPKTRHVPIIIVTGVTEREANLKAVQAGADDFLLKPFDSLLLEARILNSIKAKRLYDQIVEYQEELEDHNTKLEMAVKDRTAQLERTQLVTVFSLSKLAESRDTETGDHLERMRCYCREVALEVLECGQYCSQTSDSFPNQIYQSSPLHDIGKVGIPDRILLKPGKLTPEEFDVMKTHTLIGAETLDAADREAGGHSFLSMGHDIALNHHERWDGKGYPNGIAGEDIPLAARIVAIGDVYDALTSRRPYKEPFSHEKSMSIIMEGRGTQFDPAIVDAFVKREQQILRVRQLFKDSSRPSHIQQVIAQLEEVSNSSSA